MDKSGARRNTHGPLKNTDLEGDGGLNNSNLAF